MIRVKCMGHIGTSVGREELELDFSELKASELIDRLRQLGNGDDRLGFTRFNTLVLINEGDAFTAATSDRLIRDGDTVVLLPFSHGG